MNDFSQYVLEEDAEKLEVVTQSEETDLVQMLFSQAPMHIGLNILFATGLAVVIWNDVQTYLILPWLLFITLSCGLEFILTKLFNRAEPKPAAIPLWRRLLTFNVTCIGLAWGVGALMMLPELNALQALSMLAVMLFLAVASIPMLAALLSTYLPVLAGMLLPLCIWTYLHADTEATLYYSSSALIFIGLGLLAKNYTSILHSSFRLASIYSRLADAMSNEYQEACASKNRLKKRIRDMAAQRHSMKREKERMYSMLQSMGEGIISTDESGTIIFMNPVAEILTGWSEVEVRSRKIEDIFKLSDDSQDTEDFNPIMECLNTGAPCCSRENTVLTRKDGLDYGVECMASPIRDESGKRHGMILIFRDVTEKRNITRQISWQATHDTLTRLINRREFENRLEKLVNSARRDGYNHVLCYLDLDQFKIVNDSYGHPAGDELLKKLSAALRVHVRGTDTLARIGGDEFGVLLYSCSLDKARLIADGLRQLVEDFRFLWNGKTLRVGVSIGLVEIDNSWQDINDVLSAADGACYSAKDQGRNRIHIYRSNDQQMLKRNGEMRMIQDIQYALEHSSFELHQQRIQSLKADRSEQCQCEILTRLKSEDGSLINAADFIPTAERYRLMPQIDRWVVKTTMNAIHYRHPCFAGLDSIAINISAQSLCDDRFLQFILELLSENDVPAEMLCFEISEASYLSSPMQANQFIQRLRDKGCRFALDNFGAVSSSFNFLKNLKVDYLKIDGDFISNIVKDEMERNMVDSINHMGHRIGLQTIAQNIPDDDTLKIVKNLGVDYAQGHGVEKPLPINNLLMQMQA